MDFLNINYIDGDVILDGFITPQSRARFIEILRERNFYPVVINLDDAAAIDHRNSDVYILNEKYFFFIHNHKK